MKIKQNQQRHMHQCGDCYIIFFIIKWGALTYWGVKQHAEILIGGYIIALSKLHNYFEVKLPSWIFIFELCVLNCLLVLLYFLFWNELFWHSNAKHK